MTPTQDSSRSRRARKSSHTYSLTVDGDSFGLTSTIAPTPSCAVETIRTPPSTPPSALPSGENNMHGHAFSPVASSSRLYVPYIPVARGPRSTNLYLYPPTEADYAKARRRNILKAAATEDARKEREDDERRRNIILGIAGPRKSTRRTKPRTNLAADLENATMNTENSPSVIDRRGRKGRRSAGKATKSAIQSEPVLGDAPTSAVSPSISLLSLPPSSEAPSPPKKARRKPQPNSNPRPTQRLTTRSLAKSKASSLNDKDSVVPSEVDGPEVMDVDIEDPSESRSEDSLSSNVRHSHANFGGAHDDPNGTYTLAKMDPSELRSEDSDNRTSLSGDLPSTDTLCDDVGSLARDVPKELVSTDTPAAVAITNAHLDVLLPPSQYSVSSIGHSPSPSAVTLILDPTMPTAQDGRKKRNLEDVVPDPKAPLQTQNRRSRRVPKKRKLQ